MTMTTSRAIKSMAIVVVARLVLSGQSPQKPHNRIIFKAHRTRLWRRGCRRGTHVLRSTDRSELGRGAQRTYVVNDIVDAGPWSRNFRNFTSGLRTISSRRNNATASVKNDRARHVGAVLVRGSDDTIIFLLLKDYRLSRLPSTLKSSAR